MREANCTRKEREGREIYKGGKGEQGRICGENEGVILYM